VTANGKLQKTTACETEKANALVDANKRREKSCIAQGLGKIIKSKYLGMRHELTQGTPQKTRIKYKC